MNDSAGPSESSTDPQFASQPGEGEIFEARVINPSTAQAGIRYGSPFAVDPQPGHHYDGQGIAAATVVPESGAAAAFEAGVANETAAGGVIAATVILPLAGIALWLFPLGGMIISGLGVALSVIGLTTRRQRWSTGVLVIHICVFVAAYFRMI
ncbi:hypothetical protein SH139x_004868 [Planctomycetaceae bacterium SH139]